MCERQLSSPLASLTVDGATMIVKCWRLTRADGTIYRFTDHSSEVVFNTETYSPVGSFLASAEEATEGLTPGNRQLQGIIRSDKITSSDLRAGLFRNCKVEEFIVDPRFADIVGVLRENLYWIQQVTFNGETWEAELQGPLNKLRTTVGFTVDRRCRWKELGDDNCGINLSLYRDSGSVLSVVQSRKEFTSDVPTGNGDDYFNDGRVTWTTGNNAGVISEVKTYTETSGVVRLYVQTPFDIQVGDDFTIEPGCDRQFSTCIAKFDNKDRFGGYPDVPGNDDTFTTPDAPLE